MRHRTTDIYNGYLYATQAEGGVSFDTDEDVVQFTMTLDGETVTTQVCATALYSAEYLQEAIFEIAHELLELIQGEG